MSLKEKRAHYYTFMLEEDFFEPYEEEFPNSDLLRWSVTGVLFGYISDKFIETEKKNPNFFYDFKHPNVNMVLITNDENKIDEISGFLNYLLKDDQLMKAFFLAERDDYVDRNIFDSHLDKVLGAFQLDRELPINTNNQRKAKI
jgi:hypothetical protein